MVIRVTVLDDGLMIDQRIMAQFSRLEEFEGSLAYIIERWLADRGLDAEIEVDVESWVEK